MKRCLLICIPFESTSDKKVIITINGKAVDYTVENGYAVLEQNLEKR